MLYLLILCGDLSLNIVCSIVPQKYWIIQKIKKFYNVEKMIFKKAVFCSLKKLALSNFLKFCTMLAYGVCNMVQRKKLGVTVLLSDLHNRIHRF